MILRRPHAIRVEMVPVGGIRLVRPRYEIARILIILDQPAPPQVLRTFLIPRAPNHAESMQIDRLFDRVGGFGGFTVDQNAEALEQEVLQQPGLILLGLDDLFGKDLARDRAHIVQICIPEFQHGLPLEPAVADQQAEDDTCGVFFAAGGLGGGDDGRGDDGGMGFCDFGFFELAGDDLLDLVFQTESDFGDGSGRKGGGNEIGVGGGQD